MANIRNENATVDEEKKTGLDAKIDDLLIKERKIFLCQAVEHKIVRELMKQIWYLESVDPDKPINFYINSPGGSVTDGFALWDLIQMSSCPFNTIVMGLAASFGSFLSISTEKERRYCTPNARFMVHQPAIHGVIQGQASDLEIQAREIIKSREDFITIYQDRTGQDAKTIERALTRDTWMSAQEALEWGHIGKIITSAKEIEN